MWNQQYMTPISISRSTQALLTRSSMLVLQTLVQTPTSNLFRRAASNPCCGGCAGKFAANSKSFAERANHQLVATNQYVQKGCPFSGGKVKADKMVSIAGTKVGFCCDGCMSKVASAKDDKAKMKLVFSDKAFSKGFEKKASK